MAEAPSAPITLVADSGSTKTLWAACANGQVQSLRGTGINPMFHDAATISAVLQNDLGQIQRERVTQIFFYGAGCSSPERNQRVQQALRQHFPQAQIEVSHDLLAAARALCGTNPGIACILGTGSNACRYDGQAITAQQGGLGYILGDEGSGQHSGKLFLRKLLYGDLPQNVITDFNREFGLKHEDVLHHIYREPNPNRFLASFMPFLQRHLHEQAISSLILDSFTEFAEVHVVKLNPGKDLPVNAIGSVAFHFNALWKEALEKVEMPFGKILQEPIEELVKFHLGK